MNLHLILLVFAFVCAVLAAFNIGAPRWNMVAAALAFYFAALIFGGWSGRISQADSAPGSGQHASVFYGGDTWPDGTRIRH